MFGRVVPSTEDPCEVLVVFEHLTDSVHRVLLARKEISVSVSIAEIILCLFGGDRAHQIEDIICFIRIENTRNFFLLLVEVKSGFVLRG